MAMLEPYNTLIHALMSRGLDTNEILEGAIVGAIAAGAYDAGVFAACPGAIDLADVLWDVLEGAFAGAFAEVLESLLDNQLLAAVLSAFTTGFIFTLVVPGGCQN